MNHFVVRIHTLKQFFKVISCESLRCPFLSPNLETTELITSYSSYGVNSPVVVCDTVLRQACKESSDQ